MKAPRPSRAPPSHHCPARRSPAPNRSHRLPRRPSIRPRRRRTACPSKAAEAHDRASRQWRAIRLAASNRKVGPARGQAPTGSGKTRRHCYQEVGRPQASRRRRDGSAVSRQRARIGVRPCRRIRAHLATASSFDRLNRASVRWPNSVSGPANPRPLLDFAGSARSISPPRWRHSSREPVPGKAFYPSTRPRAVCCRGPRAHGPPH